MKYRAEIVITHVATGQLLSEVDRATLEQVVRSSLADKSPSVVVSDLVVLLRAGNQVRLHATIQESTVEPLTSPLDAISHLDKALLRALMRTGLFEEFEVARRSLHVAPLGV